MNQEETSVRRGRVVNRYQFTMSERERREGTRDSSDSVINTGYEVNERIGSVKSSLVLTGAIAIKLRVKIERSIIVQARNRNEVNTNTDALY